MDRTAHEAKASKLTLTVQPSYLTHLRTGLKTHEGRLARPHYLSLQPGNYIKISAHEDASIFRVLSVTQYKTFREMLLAYGVKAFLPGVEDVDEAVEIYRGFPGYVEGEREMGVVAIEVMLVGH